MSCRLGLRTGIAALLLAGCTTPPAEYHHFAAHPYEVRELTATLALADHDPATAVVLAGRFAAARPNNGSSFVITADAANAQRLRSSLVAAGVSGGEISLVSAVRMVGIERRDRIATVAGCYGGPRSVIGIGTLDDGFDHSNSNSTLFGCAVRRNIAAMIDDPRTLVTTEPAGPRDGARAAAVYEDWTKGQATAARVTLPTPRTATTSVDSGPAQ